MPRNNKAIRITKKPFDFVLVVIICILLALGIIMVLSASAPSSLSETGSSYKYFYKQFAFAIAGFIVMLIVSKIDYRIYKEYYWWIYWISVVILLLVAVPGLGVTVKGATRWIRIAGQRVQPSEISKIGLIIFYAGYLTDHKKDLSSFQEGFVKPILWILPPVAILFFIQNHLSVCLVIIAITAIMMLMAGSRFKYFFTSGCAGIGALLVYLLSKVTAGGSGEGSFRLTRITTFLNPWADATGDGWQIIQSLYAIGSGGLFGVGLGDSTQKYLYIPEPHNDFIFSIVAEELGFFGCAIVIILFGLLIWRCSLVAIKAPDMFGSLIAIGITTLIAVQVVINIAVVTSSMPVTGMSLPFFSYGGSALLILMSTIGILLNISRNGNKV